MNKTISVLVIDPDPTELYRVCEIVASLGVDDISCASTFDDAMKYMKASPDLVVTDANRIPRAKGNPEMIPGEYLIQRIKERSKNTFLIGQMTDVCGARMVNALRCGADDIIEKRERPSKLLSKMPIWLAVARDSLVVNSVVAGAACLMK